MCERVHVYECVLCMCISMYTGEHACVHVSVHVCTGVHVHEFLRTCVSTCMIYVWVCAHV